MKRPLIYLAFVLLAVCSILLLNRDTKIENIKKETPTNVDANTFYYDSYFLISDSNVVSGRYSESGVLSLNENLVTLNRGAGQINYMIDSMNYDDSNNIYTFYNSKSNVVFDPSMRSVTFVDEGIQFHISSTIKSNW